VSDLVVSTLDGHVVQVEINRPPNNFFDLALIRAIADACEAAADDGSRAVVLCAAGKHFCAGADFGGGGSGGATDGDGRHLYDEAIRLFEQPLPIVAAVQGAAVGGGLGLVMAADFRVAGPDARFTANFSRLGFHQGFGLSVTLPAVVGQQAALDLLYTGRRIGTEAAAGLGLVDHVAEEPRAAAVALAQEIAGSGPLAVRSIRVTMRAALVDAVRAALARERAEQDRLMRTADFREGIAASAARRDPEFTGQ
jgi:2-(1,2-epoxy-1,2-dihydrophenyl)acetyl-CoA isomerase